MGSNYQLLLGGQQADQTLYTLITSVQVDESMDMPAAIQVSLPISRSTGGDLTYIDDPRFAPMAQLAVVATAGGSGASGVATGAVGAVTAAVGGGSAPSATQCIFDGYVLSQSIHLETGVTNATLTAWGQDACWLMNQTETVKEWVDVTDADVAASIFGTYGITPASDNSQNNSPAHTEDTHSLMQRGSDISFLRMLARRSGKCCRVACADKPGQRTGYFAVPNLNGDPAVSIKLNDPSNWSINAIDLEWDAMRPTAVVARSALFSDSDPNGAVRRFQQLRPQPARCSRPAHVRRLADDRNPGDRSRQRRRAHPARPRPAQRDRLVRALPGGGGGRPAGCGAAGRHAGLARRHRCAAFGDVARLERPPSADAGGPQDALHVAPQRCGQPADRQLRRPLVACGRRMTDPAQQHHGSSHIDRTLIDVLERLRNRFFGKYRGVVTDVDAGTMRVKASVPAVLGETALRLG